MTYRVIYAPSVREDIRQHVAYLRGESVTAATIEQWYVKLFELIDSLDEWPDRFPVDEVQSEAVGEEIRKLNVGDYLVFYQVDHERKEVNVFAFMHGAGRHKA